ncbi:MAG: phage head-tail connector protein, partial [Phenylobacterium sp.]|nr:phage head-tail connector protein [Phenylobacterium sp.]
MIAAWTRLTWTTPSAAIVTISELKSHLRVDFDDDDDLMSDLVVAAQAHIEGPEGIGLALAPSTWRLSLDGFPADQVIAIPLGPLTAVTGISYVDPAGATQTLNLANVRID